MVDNLKVYQDGKGRNLMDWIQEKGEMIYTDVGKKTWRVPPVKFNTQVLTQQKLAELKNDQQNIRIEGCILGQLNPTDQENNRAENFVCGTFEKLSNDLVKAGQGSAMFLIANFEYDSYLNKMSHFFTETHQEKAADNQSNKTTVGPDSNSGLPEASRPVVKLPKDVTNRGELDTLILHQDAGVVLVQTKAVGYNFMEENSYKWRNSSINTAIEKACGQLIRDRRVLLHIMGDLGLRDDQITGVVTLPNLSKKTLLEEISSEMKHRIESEFNLDLDTSFLYEEDLKPDSDGCLKALTKWWEEVLLPSAKSITLQTMQQIAFRTVGLMSTVKVWAYTQPRIEVRNQNEAAWETGNRYTQVVLSPQQVELLRHEDQYMYLWGPAGSGKTLLLALKGRQWLRQNRNVAILNTRLGSRGRTVGQVIETTINKTEDLMKKVVRIDLDLMDNEETLMSIVSEHVKGQVFYFLLDEIAWVEETEKLLLLLKKTNPYSTIWCAGMLIECQPSGFVPRGLEVILRCPPSVQRVLRIVDNRDERCELYKLDSAKAGLPTDGLQPFFIIHSRHGDSSVQPYDCHICARELSDFLINQLNMKSRANKQDSANQGSSEKDHQECNQSDLSKSCTGDAICNSQSKCEETSLNQLGSSVGSDSGCDCKDRTLGDPLDPEAVSIQDDNSDKTKKSRNRSNKNNNNKNNNSGSGSQNNNSKGRVNTTTPDSQNQNVTPSTKMQNSPTTIKATENKTINPDLDIFPAKVKKPQTKKPGPKQQPAQGNNCENSEVKKPGKKSSGKKENSVSSINSSKNQQKTKCDQENTDENQNTITSGDTVSKKAKKSRHKSKKKEIDSSTDNATYSQLNFSDAVLPVTVPRAWHHYNKRGYWSISREALAQEMVLLGSRAFCQDLFYSGVPLKVEEAMVMKAEGKELENHFVMCPVGAVHGLEYKLVVCVPSACALPEYIEISEGIRHGNMEPKVKMKRTQFGTDYLKKEGGPSCEETNMENVPKIDKVRISTHVAEEGAPYDMLYVPLPEGDVASVSAEKLMYPESEAASPHPYIPPSYTDEEIRKIKNELCGHCSDKDKCVCKYFNKDELAAVHKLEAWNRAYVLMCASRCTSVLVLVLP